MGGEVHSVGVWAGGDEGGSLWLGGSEVLEGRGDLAALRRISVAFFILWGRRVLTNREVALLVRGVEGLEVRLCITFGALVHIQRHVYKFRQVGAEAF